MYDYKPLIALLNMLAVCVVGTAWAFTSYLPKIPLEALGIIFFGGFMSGGVATALYMLIRYRRELTLGDVQE